MKRWMIAGALALVSMAAVAADPAGFDEAKTRADRDEASLVPPQDGLMREAQSRQLDAVVAACSSPNPDLAPLVVVVQLDARGKIIKTWRSGESVLAKCIEHDLTGRFLAAPPRAPFYASFELSFTP